MYFSARLSKFLKIKLQLSQKIFLEKHIQLYKQTIAKFDLLRIFVLTKMNKLTGF